MQYKRDQYLHCGLTLVICRNGSCILFDVLFSLQLGGEYWRLQLHLRIAPLYDAIQAGAIDAKSFFFVLLSGKLKSCFLHDRTANKNLHKARMPKIMDEPDHSF